MLIAIILFCILPKQKKSLKNLLPLYHSYGMMDEQYKKSWVTHQEEVHVLPF
jgi:hypothetical protein